MDELAIADIKDEGEVGEPVEISIMMEESVSFLSDRKGDILEHVALPVHKLVFEVEELHDDQLEDYLEIDDGIPEVVPPGTTALDSLTETASEGPSAPKKSQKEPPKRRGRKRKRELDPKPVSKECRKKACIPEKVRRNRYYKYKVIEKDSKFFLEVEGDDIKSNSCESCSENFRTFKVFKQHMNVNHDICLYECSICEDPKNVTVTLDSIEHHMITKHPEDHKYFTAFKCISLTQALRPQPPQQIFEEKYSYSLMVLAGYRLILLSDNTKLPTFNCQECLENFENETQLREHIKAKHLFSVFKCVTCDLIISFEDLELHLKRSHSNFEKVSAFKCVDADGSNKVVADTKYSYVFSQKDGGIFELVLTDEKKTSGFLCEECKDDFSNETLMKSHIEEVHGTLEFTCDTCDAYVELKFIEKHLIKHEMFYSKFLFTSLKKIDNQEYTSAFSYVLHENQGFELNMFYRNFLKSSFDCSICLKQLDDVKVLEAHMKQNHTIYNFKCKICLKFLQFPLLDQHCESHSSDPNEIFAFTCLDEDRRKISRAHNFTYKLVNSIAGIHLTVIDKQQDKDYFSCESCREEFTKLQNFVEHARLNHHLQKFECYLCKVFKEMESMVQHLRICHTLKLNVVYNFRGVLDDKCLKPLSTKSSHQWSFNFQRVKDLLKISQNEFNDVYCLQLIKEDSPNFDCMVCCMFFSDIFEMKNHLAEKHYSLEKYFCTVCGSFELFKYLNLGCHDHNQDVLYFLTVTENEDPSMQIKISDLIAKSMASTSTNELNHAASDRVKYYSYMISANSKKFNILVEESMRFELVCKLCKLSLLSVPLVRHHLWAKHHVHNFNCTHCFEDVSVDGFVDHMTKKHSGNMCSRSLFSCEKPLIGELENRKPRKKRVSSEMFSAECCYYFIEHDGIKLVLQTNKPIVYYCQICETTFPTQCHLQIHMKVNHSINKILCNDCEKKVKFPELLDHCNHHKFTKMATFTCIDTTCLSPSKYTNFFMTFSKKGSDPFKLFVIKMVDKASLFKCHCCDLTIHDPVAFEFHIKLNHKSPNFRCDSCNATVAVSNILKHLSCNHILKVKTAYTFKYCESPSTTKPWQFVKFDLHLSENMFLELEDRGQLQNIPFECHICYTNSKSLEHFEAHMIDEHYAPIKFACKLCFKMITFPRLLNHMKECHPSLKKLTFVDKENLYSKENVKNEIFAESEDTEPVFEDSVDVFECVDVKPELVNEHINVETCTNFAQVKEAVHSEVLVENQDNLPILEEFIVEDPVDVKPCLTNVETNETSNDSSTIIASERSKDNESGTDRDLREIVSKDYDRTMTVGSSVNGFEHFSIVLNSEYNEDRQLEEEVSSREKEPNVDYEISEDIDLYVESDFGELMDDECVKDEKSNFESHQKQLSLEAECSSDQKSNLEKHQQEKELTLEAEEQCPPEFIEEPEMTLNNNSLEIEDEPCNEEPRLREEIQDILRTIEMDDETMLADESCKRSQDKILKENDSFKGILKVVKVGKQDNNTVIYNITCMNHSQIKGSEFEVDKDDQILDVEEITKHSINSEQLSKEASESSSLGTIESIPVMDCDETQATDVKKDTNIIGGNFLMFMIYIRLGQMLFSSKKQIGNTSSICNICCKLFKLECLKTHIKTVHGITDLFCSKCNIVVKADVLESHPPICKRFTYSLVTEPYLKLIVQKKIIKSSSACRFCGLNFETEPGFRSHLLYNHKSMCNFTCSICEKELNFESVEEHTLTHEDLPSYICRNLFGDEQNVILPEFAFNLTMIESEPFIEVIRNTNVEITACDICEIQFKESCSFKTHLKENHNIINYLCKMCDISFDDIARIKKHLHIRNHPNYFLCGLKEGEYMYQIQIAQPVIKSCPDHLKNQVCFVLVGSNKLPRFHCKICHTFVHSLTDLHEHYFDVHHTSSEKFCCLRCKMIIKVPDFGEHVNTNHSGISKVSFISIADLKLKTKRIRLRTDEVKRFNKTTNVPGIHDGQNKLTLPKKIIPKEKPSIVSVNSKPTQISLTSKPACASASLPQKRLVSNSEMRAEVITSPDPSPHQKVDSGGSLKNMSTISTTLNQPRFKRESQNCTEILLVSNIEYLSKEVPTPSLKNFTFTFGMNKKKPFCVFVKRSEFTEYYCLLCSNLNLLNYKCFLKHIERQHFKYPIGPSICNICSERKCIDFEPHVRQHHLGEEKIIFFELLVSYVGAGIGTDYNVNNFSLTFFQKREKNFVKVISSDIWKFYCEVCRTAFNIFSELSHHIQQRHKLEISQITCRDCKTTLLKVKSLPSHIANKHKNAKCMILKITLQDSLLILLENFEDQPLTDCEANEPKFSLAYDIDSGNDHCVILKAANLSEDFSCTLCQISFNDCSELTDHIENSHIHDKISYSICEKCCRVLSSILEFSEHIKTLHANESNAKEFQFKLISLKTSILEDIEEGLTMRDMLTPSPTFEDDGD